MKFLNWLLYQVHRWFGIAVGIFMFFWFFTGLIIMYSPALNQSRTQQLAHAESLQPQSDWLSLNDIFLRYKAQRQQSEINNAKNAQSDIHLATESAAIQNIISEFSEAKLQRVANIPVWLLEDVKGKRILVSALDGNVLNITADHAQLIAQNWANQQGLDPNKPITFVETTESSIFLRNQDNQKPFHKFKHDDNDYQILISSRTGEVIHASTVVGRAFYFAGNWLHLFKPLSLIGFDHLRHDVQLWSGFIAFIASLTGLIIGWLRWRPGFRGKRTYSQGRTQPYREFWFKWHFWSGLIGGTLALFWAFSGYIDTNPGKIFGSGELSKEEQAQYYSQYTGNQITDWKPSVYIEPVEIRDVVELVWRRLGSDFVVLAYDRDGQRWPQVVEGASAQFSSQSLASAVTKINPKSEIASQVLLNDYDNYYYPRHNQSRIERPLPVLKVVLADDVGSHLYIDPQDGKILTKNDSSRRVFRWLYSALHHWDFGWLYYRPLWDLWMITWVSFGLVLGLSSLVIGWKRLKISFVPKKSTKKSAVSSQLVTE